MISRFSLGYHCW